MAELTSSGKSGSRSSRTRQVPRIDLTAMVDLAFLLITFFIMATSLAKPKAMDLAMPADTQSEPVGQSRTMTICLGNNNHAIWYLGMIENPLIPPTSVDFSKTGLRQALINTSKKVLRVSGKSIIVILKPGEHAVYADFISALDELNIANIRSYAVAKITPKDIDMLRQLKAY